MNYAWYCDVMNDPRHLRPITHNLDDGHGGEKLAFAIAASRRNAAGESLGSDYFPDMIFPSSRATRPLNTLPNIFFAGSYWVVSERCADVLRQFDLGGGGLFPVKVCQKDKVTPVGDHDWFCINFSNVKPSLDPEASNHIWPFGSHKVRWTVMGALVDDDLVVSREALSGPDIWVEPKLLKAIFISDALGKALKKAKCTSGWGLYRARVMGG